MRLDETLPAIAAAAIAMLDAANAVGELLDGIATINLSERSRPRPDLPALYVFLGTARVMPTSRTLTIKEAWQVPLTVVALVSSDEPEVGYIDCMSWASKARSVLLRGRNLALDFVGDVQSASFDPAYRMQVDNRMIYGAAATLTVTFVVAE